MVEPKVFDNVNEDVVIYDTARIRKNIEGDAPKVFQNFTQLANVADGVPFFDIRNLAEVGKSYTNVESKDGLAYPFRLESIGCRFVYPDPFISGQFISDWAASKMFMQILPDHAHFELTIREDIRVALKPVMMSAGWGVQGWSVGVGQPANTSVLTNGEPHLGNRFRFLQSAIDIPRNCPVRGRLKFSKYAQDMLEAMVAPNDLQFDDQGVFDNEALIEFSLRGVRGVQQRGDLHF